MIFSASFGFIAAVLAICGVCTPPLPKKIYYFHSAGEIFLVCGKFLFVIERLSWWSETRNLTWLWVVCVPAYIVILGKSVGWQMKQKYKGRRLTFGNGTKKLSHTGVCVISTQIQCIGTRMLHLPEYCLRVTLCSLWTVPCHLILCLVCILYLLWIGLFGFIISC